ncbi:hypothetical protein W97_06699 [Coniosporium apollinis CBS 100218]|uniref:Peptidase S54 rhomboid domain-containing protein n=1 Tax=Coniosporium apollinis (strain CBS 100218) TaxID=1168221 RepID=R7YZQ8_CONA1|nr:uncharacterized protein W97_06699 [Coniosporium apollinis CBS 100218]EON67445.1 hypothetical protein W97_06699 [Coniosporium apollinis CBS 100218]
MLLEKNPKQVGKTRSKASAKSSPRARIPRQRSVPPKETTPVEDTASEKGPVHYDWRKYSDKTGMPLPSGDLVALDITKIFGEEMGPGLGNRILRILQWRRESGSLGDFGISLTGDTDVTQEQCLRGLEWLRANFPVDEEAAAEAWRERELERLYQVMEKDSQRLGFYKRDDALDGVDLGQPQQGTEFGQRYARSELAAIREENERRWEEKQKELEELEQRQREQRPPREGQEEPDVVVQARERLSRRTGLVLSADRSADYIEQGRQAREKYNKYWEEKAQIIKDNEAPNMSAFQRLWPSALVTAATLGFCILLAQTYEPPTQSGRLWPNTPPALSTCVGILLANVAIFILWRVPPAWPTLNRYFALCPGYPIALSNVFNTFSHQQLGHLATNMVLFMVIGPKLHEEIGRGNFLALYLAAGTLGSFASLTYHVLLRRFITSSLGASGAVYGILAAWCLIRAADHLRIPFTDLQIPLSSKQLLGVMLALELFNMWTGKVKGVDHLAHLGGYGAGIAGASWLMWRASERRRVVEEKRRKMGFLERTFNVPPSAGEK